MSINTKSFFDRLTGSFSDSDDKGDEYESPETEEDKPIKEERKEEKQDWLSEDEEGQLAVDMYHTPNEIIIQTMVAGVKQEDLDISIGQGMITVKGKRHKVRELSEDNYYYKELYWGSFSRSIVLPQDIDMEKIDAGVKNGVLTIHLPKINKERVQKIKVKNE